MGLSGRAPGLSWKCQAMRPQPLLPCFRPFRYTEAIQLFLGQICPLAI